MNAIAIQMRFRLIWLISKKVSFLETNLKRDLFFILLPFEQFQLKTVYIGNFNAKKKTKADLWRNKRFLSEITEIFH